MGLEQAWNRVIAKCSAPSQKGFIRGRHFTDHVVEVDTEMRILSLDVNKTLPNAFLADFSHAFCAVAHDWIML
eukprot:4948625-Karenia_brevis.AAC.1